MSKSNWLPDDKQTGNFSNDKKDTFDPKKRYVGIRLQQGVPLLDRDWNELEDIRRYAEVMLGQYYIGNGTPDENSFKITAADPPANDFKIFAGRCLVDGFEVVNEPVNAEGNPLEFILYSQQDGVAPLSVPAVDRSDTVYLDVWIEEVRGDKEDALKNLQDIKVETCTRHKLNWQVKVSEGTQELPGEAFHHYYPIAVISRKPGKGNIETGDIVDLRRTGLAMYLIKAGLDLLTGQSNADAQHTHSQLVRPGAVPALALQVDQNGNVGIGTVEPGKKLDVNGDIRANNFYKLLPHNIISNSFMNRLNGNVPIGFTIGSYNAGNSTMQIEAVHPFTKGFEGPYSPSKPENAVDNVNDATGSNPYWFGRYWKGPRAARGGLADGWMGRSDGHILKITGRRDAAIRSSNIYVMFPKEQRVLTARLLFRAWVKITKGAIDFGTDMGVNPQITRDMTETAPQGWYFINRIFDSSHVTDIGGHAFIFKCLGEEAVHGGDFEIYLALPYLANIEIDDSPHWSPSILDILSDYGATIDLDTGNVGIGTTSPASKLHINSDGTTSLRLTGAGKGYTNAEIVLEATNYTNSRGLGIFMHDAGGDTEWYAGTPYADADQYQIGRASGVTSHSGATAQVSNAFLTIKNSGNVGIGTTTPGAKLDVGGSIYAGNSDIYFTKTNHDYTGIGNAPGFAAIENAADYNALMILGRTQTIDSVRIVKLWDYLQVNGSMDITGKVGIGTQSPAYTLHTEGTSYAVVRKGGAIDYAEYFESKNGMEIKPGTSVVLDGDKIRPAQKGENPFGIISANPLIVGGVPVEWPKKFLKDEFGNQIMEEYKEEIMAPKKEKVKKERQKAEKKKVKEEVTRTEVVKIKGKYCQKEITETIEREIQEPVFKEEDLYDAKGKEVIGKHRIPVMETYQEVIDVLDEKGQPVMMGTGKFETKTRAKINPEHDETKEYIPREKRPEWNCVGLLGQLPLLKGQPTAPTWIKIKDLTKDVELWLVK